MTDAYENENLQQEGQVVDNVGQDEGQTLEESSGYSKRGYLYAAGWSTSSTRTNCFR